MSTTTDTTEIHDQDATDSKPDDTAQTPARDDQQPPPAEDTTTDQPGDEDLAALRAERDQLAAQVLRLTVAAETGVPADLLTADTDEDLRAQAAKLLEFSQARRRPVPDPSQGPRGKNTPSTDPIGDRIRNR